MAEKQKEVTLQLVPLLNQKDKAWRSAHGGPRNDDDYNYEIPDGLDATINETVEERDEYFRDLEERRRLEGVAAREGLRVIVGGRR